ncbi:MAG: hypothetical protein LUF68_01340 [Clostridiales bacterium]|nr:hypothetical protein [Clostridiales bacterium]
MRHEAGHDRIGKGEVNPADVRARLREKYSEAEIQALGTLYAQLYSGTGLSAAEIWEEVICDSLGDMNAFSETSVSAFVEELLGDTRQAAQTQETAQATESTTGPPEGKTSISYDRENRPFVTVEEDILAGVPREDWVKTVKDNLREKFPDGVTVGNSEIQIDSHTRREMTWSRYSQWLRNENPDLFADKLRATNNADEILFASRDYINEGLNHTRKDDIRSFARGTVQLRIGRHDYKADVVIGARANGTLVLYDLLNLQETRINEKSQARQTANPSPGAGRNTVTDFSFSIPTNGENVKKKFSMRLSDEDTDSALKSRQWAILFRRATRRRTASTPGSGAPRKSRHSRRL